MATARLWYLEPGLLALRIGGVGATFLSHWSLAWNKPCRVMCRSCKCRPVKAWLEGYGLQEIHLPVCLWSVFGLLLGFLNMSGCDVIPIDTQWYRPISGHRLCSFGPCHLLCRVSWLAFGRLAALNRRPQCFPRSKYGRRLWGNKPFDKTTVRFPVCLSCQYV